MYELPFMTCDPSIYKIYIIKFVIYLTSLMQLIIQPYNKFIYSHILLKKKNLFILITQWIFMSFAINYSIKQKDKNYLWPNHSTLLIKKLFRPQTHTHCNLLALLTNQIKLLQNFTTSSVVVNSLSKKKKKFY